MRSGALTDLQIRSKFEKGLIKMEQESQNKFLFYYIGVRLVPFLIRFSYVNSVIFTLLGSWMVSETMGSRTWENTRQTQNTEGQRSKTLFIRGKWWFVSFFFIFNRAFNWPDLVAERAQMLHELCLGVKHNIAPGTFILALKEDLQCFSGIRLP